MRGTLTVAASVAASLLVALPTYAAPATAPGVPVPAAGSLHAAVPGAPAFPAAPADPANSAVPATPASPAAPTAARQAAFKVAAGRYGVPESVLLGVSYLESRWDANRGVPSVTAGYGPMHLTDARAALPGTPHHSEGAEDPRGDDARPAKPASSPPASTASAAPPASGSASAAPVTSGNTGAAPPVDGAQTVDEAARLSGLPAERLVTDPDANLLGGAALLARYQKDLADAKDPGLAASRDPADWYGAVARYSGADDVQTARQFADEVFSVLREGASRTTDDGQQVSLPAGPEIAPRMDQVDRLGLREAEARNTECPKRLACEWFPAPYQKLSEDPGDYGNHDLSDRPHNQRIQYIVLHDTEETYDRTLKLVADPTYVSWHYTIRSADGHIAQHVKARDVAWHAGNWYVNAKSIGIEHEGFLAKAGSWYTEAMYRSSARLVGYLAKRYDIPLDRAHILGHDNVPGTVPGTVAGMHVDPGPYWDWGHYFALLHRPFKSTGGAHGGLVTIRTDYAHYRPRYTGCDQAGVDCPPHGSASVWLHTEPSDSAPLVKDIGRRPGGESTYDVSDHGARATTGQQYALAGREGDWTAIWYLGQLAWFRNPREAPTAVNATGLIVTPKPGRGPVPVYGRAYPEPEAYPAGVPVQAITPLQYVIPQGQRYSVGLVARGEYYYAVTFDPATHTVVRGRTLYYQIQLGHRVAFVKADDVNILPSAVRAPR
ncbi:peptidoglycan recognition protein family protein [Sphaerisporangium corydalis]|uniref:N-acetylmuramoyl-L-alanine amidase n=1 Tax=Sphaerisporangium corydalis TaxID=1441875 RepID=A0ABV9E8J0_9ACTN|nr:peptidoglycan recognition family protein [Sphaerisporangium corydalis]